MQQNTHQENLNKQSIRSPKEVSRKSRRGKKSAGAFQTISEVASILGVQQHVLRFWESKFTQVKPLKRGGGRRYYRPEDVKLLQRIHHLLYEEGYTIRGVQKLLKSTRGSVAALDKKIDDSISAEVEVLTENLGNVKTTNNLDVKVKAKSERKEMLKIMLEELKSMRKLIDV